MAPDRHYRCYNLTVIFGLQFPRIHIDTDPENMLEADQPDRLFYHRVKNDFGINDIIVVGISVRTLRNKLNRYKKDKKTAKKK